MPSNTRILELDSPIGHFIQRLGYAGLVPFVLGFLLIWLIGDRDLDQHAFVSLALSAYAALVIAFLGVVIGGMVVALYMPMFTLYDKIQ